MKRPSAGQWLRYVFGGRLPPALREWVWHDLTDSDWQLREALRIVIQAVVPSAVLLLLPGPWPIRVLALALLLFGALFVAVAYARELRDRRLRQHGFEPPRPRS